MGSTMCGLDFPPMTMPPLPPRRDPMPPMPPLGMGSMRDTGFSRGNEYGMFSRRSPPPSGNNGRFRWVGTRRTDCPFVRLNIVNVPGWINSSCELGFRWFVDIFSSLLHIFFLLSYRFQLVSPYIFPYFFVLFPQNSKCWVMDKRSRDLQCSLHYKMSISL